MQGLTVALAISILGAVISVSSFVLNRKDKSNKDVSTEAYKEGKLDAKLDYMTEQIKKILSILDSYDIEIDQRIEKAIAEHEKIYHKGDR